MGQTDDCTVQIDYRTNYEDVMLALKLVERADTKNKRWVVLIVWCALAVCTLALSPLFSSVFVAAAVYTLYTRWVRPQLNRRRLAKQIGDKGVSYSLKVFAKGIAITEGEQTHRMFYSEMRLIESDSLFLFFHKQYALMVIPKRYFGEQLAAAQQVFSNGIAENYRKISE
ncbi:YcxB family protein [Hydrogenoanaerobacterium sp.]|uniref:YcxB family protein n=1 Tax=Hydrogenoanaerobacterium sp. TaxID=2953763 RepID=UPI002897F3A5|nr:YcxB family protein [Hydrogenoanaerobacterium sp.]